MHVELAPRRREAVIDPGRRRGAAEGGGEVCPSPGGGIVHVQVVEVACTGRTGSHRLHAGRAARMRTHAWLSAPAACTNGSGWLLLDDNDAIMMACSLHSQTRTHNYKQVHTQVYNTYTHHTQMFTNTCTHAYREKRALMNSSSHFASKIGDYRGRGESLLNP
jgi:hypothetical protein